MIHLNLTIQKRCTKMQIYVNTRYLKLGCLTLTTIRIQRVRNCSGNINIQVNCHIVDALQLIYVLFWFSYTSSHYMAFYTRSGWCELTTSLLLYPECCDYRCTSYVLLKLIFQEKNCTQKFFLQKMGLYVSFFIHISFLKSGHLVPELLKQQRTCKI